MENPAKANEKINEPNLTSEQLEIVAKITLRLTQLGLDFTFIKPVSVGPVVSVYRFMPKGRTSVANLSAAADDIALALGAEDVLIKRFPGEVAVSFFVPNKERHYVNFTETVTNVWQAVNDTPHGPPIIGKMSVPLNLGVDHRGFVCIEDLATLPHLLIAGSTGSGKSTLLSSIIGSLIYCCSPEQINFILSDTKGVEFGHFVGAPHLLFEPANTIYKTLEQLEWVIEEMEKRLKLLAKLGLRNVHEWNNLGTTTPLPFVVIIIDELADLLADRSKEENSRTSIGKIAEGFLSKIVQKSRATGIYVIAATQRPSVNVVIGSMKANFPARLTFRLPSEADSRTVISQSGAEHLLSRGDMLYVSPNRPGISRLHAPLASLNDINSAVEMAVARSK